MTESSLRERIAHVKACYLRFEEVRRRGGELLPVAGGARLQRCCPFHDDRRPSFTIYSDQLYYCFGCGAWSDLLDFVQQRDQWLPMALLVAILGIYLSRLQLADLFHFLRQAWYVLKEGGEA